MNKELEDAIEILIKENPTWKKEEAIVLLRNYIENSIPKQIIENKIKVLEELQNEFKDNEEIRIKIIAYKELLEGK